MEFVARRAEIPGALLYLVKVDELTTNQFWDNVSTVSASLMQWLQSVPEVQQGYSYQLSFCPVDAGTWGRQFYFYLVFLEPDRLPVWSGSATADPAWLDTGAATAALVLDATTKLAFAPRWRPASPVTTLSSLYAFNPQVYQGFMNNLAGLIKAKLPLGATYYPVVGPSMPTGWLVARLETAPLPEMVSLFSLDNLQGLFLQEPPRPVKIWTQEGGRQLLEYRLHGDLVANLRTVLEQSLYGVYVLGLTETEFHLLLVSLPGGAPSSSTPPSLPAGSELLAAVGDQSKAFYPRPLDPAANYSSLYAYLRSAADPTPLLTAILAVVYQGLSQSSKANPTLGYISSTPAGWIVVRLPTLSQLGSSPTAPVIREILGMEAGVSTPIPAPTPTPTPAPGRPVPLKPGSVISGWRVVTAKLPSEGLLLRFFDTEGRSVSWRQMLSLGATGASIPFLVGVLREAAFTNYLWECSPFSWELSSSLEFSFALRELPVESRPAQPPPAEILQRHYAGYAGRTIAEALFVQDQDTLAALPLPPNPGYAAVTNLAGLVRSGQPEVVIEYLRLVFERLQSMASNRPAQSWWVSERPGRLPWPHIRIATSPAGYVTEAFLQIRSSPAASSSTSGSASSSSSTAYDPRSLGSRFDSIPQTQAFTKEPLHPKLGVPHNTANLYLSSVKSLNFPSVDATMPPAQFSVRPPSSFFSGGEASAGAASAAPAREMVDPAKIKGSRGTSSTYKKSQLEAIYLALMGTSAGTEGWSYSDYVRVLNQPENRARLVTIEVPRS